LTGFALRQKDGVCYLTFDSFSRAGLVTHAFSTRRGGVSEGPYAGLNMSFRVGDRPENVLINRLSICRALGAEPAGLVAAAQVHGDRVARVTAEHRGNGAAEAESALPATDALITNEPGVLLSSYHADCVPVFLLDPVRKAIGVAHAGWKGTVLKIAARTVEAMQQSFGTRPRDCLAGIGPAIGPCCYEVDEPVFSRFQSVFPDWPALFTPAAPGHWYLNLWEANRRALLEAGLQEERITAANLCTSCRQDLFFSHRASGGRAGRMAALLMLRP